MPEELALCTLKPDMVSVQATAASLSASASELSASGRSSARAATASVICPPTSTT